MTAFVRELHLQYADGLATLDKILQAATPEVWMQRFGQAAFWHEAYHNLFWSANFIGGPGQQFSFQPFGVDIDPRLFAEPGGSLELPVAREYLANERSRVDAVFQQLTDEQFDSPDVYGESNFRCVGHRLMYQFRHLSHHNGKLAAWLRDAGCEDGFW